MRILQSGALALTAAILAACGGGGGGGNGGDPGLPLTPTNSLITDLRVDQTFTGPAATSDSMFNTVSGTTVSSGGAPATLSVAYNAAAKSYTLTLPGRSQTFSNADVVSTSVPGETRFLKAGAAGNDRLTLVTTPYSGNTPNRYVGLGIWQQSSSNAGRQNDKFATFVYGLNTPVAAMPRTGRANFAIDVFALSTVPGFEPSVLQGEGRFDVDFLAGVFSTQTYLTETGLITGSGVVGGGIELIGAGLVSSGEPTFSGNVTFGSRNAKLSGSLSGRFYGPGAEELGASFSATNADGATAAGSFTGQRGAAQPVNLTLADLVTPQLFYAQGMGLFMTDLVGRPGTDVRTYRMIGQLQDRTSGNLSFGPGLSNMAGGEFTTASIITGGDANFTTYQKTFASSDVRLELYKVGPANRELALTYASLGRWQSVARNAVETERQYHHFVYGLETPANLLAARTGSARYEGVVYGAAGNRTSGVHYDVRGSSSFDVDFSRQAFTGALALDGRADSGNVDFGRYDFSGRLTSQTSAATITRDGASVGDMVTRFFGPSGEEIGGDFTLRVPEAVQSGGTLITGATVARRR